MPQTIVTRPIGPTYFLGVGTTQTIAIGVRPTPHEPMNYCEFTHTTTTSVCVVMAPLPPPPANPTTPSLVFPNATSAATAPTSFIITGNSSRVVPVPANGFSVSAIASAGTSSVFVTPVSVM
jgi:hypothetical protein